MEYLQGIAVLLVALVVYKVYRLWGYVRAAKKTGFTYVVVPLLETEVVAQLATLILRKLYTDQLDAGNGWPSWCRFMIKDWSWEDKRSAHEQYGDVFLVVSPAGIICYVADADVAWDVLNRRHDFTKPRDKYKILEPYGPNVATAEGSTYRFHLRITAPPFSDGSGANELVWQETARQTELLADKWEHEALENVDDAINALTLAVISFAGFGKKVVTSQGQSRDVPAGYRISFLQALSDVTKFMLQILVFPTWFLSLTPYANAGLAKTQLEQYMKEMIRREKASIETGKDTQTGPRGNLLQSVMLASHHNSQSAATGKDDSLGRGFNESEVMGNLFIYLLAGYETTANAIAYGLITLALRPDIQARVAAEIDQVYKQAAAEGRKELDYSSDFPRLEYTYGFMYETFRLYPGVTLITKMCKTAQDLRVFDGATGQTRTATIPAECRVYLSAPAVHYHPKYWPEPEELEPARWMRREWTKNQDAPPAGKADRHVVAADKTRQMRGTLLTFSDGSRACLGRKFAQAEFIAFLAVLLRRFEVCFEPGVDVEQARRDLNFKSAGRVTLAPIDGFKLAVRKRVPGGSDRRPDEADGMSRRTRRD
ncbi:Cytochrome P450 [Colletotrichum higginsianum IMI 349063]|uniref:Cytochrome P450 n=2 Tax=Colletotrichum higginsianum TaxID=80884 RepID=A0A1B7YFW7_COLHI|nr:Cytochrome P450 [Colletotrichum higginsianum IMI 349063]OBR10840.1 Cytochrome P450 [Colletotrichum higginsianum IMI 349063]TID06358.1 Cytochrome P450 3A9 [Colletotrichum higginsianum]